MFWGGLQCFFGLHKGTPTKYPDQALRRKTTCTKSSRGCCKRLRSGRGLHTRRRRAHISSSTPAALHCDCVVVSARLIL